MRPPSHSLLTTMATEDLATQLAVVQAELVATKSEASAKVSSLEETIGNLAHEIAILKRRLYGNKTERSHTSELQLALGDLLASEAKLQDELDDAVAKAALEPEPKSKPARPATPKGRRDLSTSTLPRVLIEIFVSAARAAFFPGRTSGGNLRS